MRKIVLCACFAFVGVALVGCSTIEGAGKDLQSASRAVQEAM